MRIALRDIIEWGGITLVAGDDDVMVEGATADSRDVVPGCLFVGVSGENVDGGLHAADAIAQGAVAVDDEDQLGLLQTGLAARARGITALANLVAAIYPGLDPGLRSAAALTVMAHLQKLEQSGPG